MNVVQHSINIIIVTLKYFQSPWPGYSSAKVLSYAHHCSDVDMLCNGSKGVEGKSSLSMISRVVGCSVLPRTE